MPPYTGEQITKVAQLVAEGITDPTEMLDFLADGTITTTTLQLILKHLASIKPPEKDTDAKYPLPDGYGIPHATIRRGLHLPDEGPGGLGDHPADRA